ncbi:translation initiation factor 1A [Strigomonas culicis]|uniref:Translation initiation factor 1A n=1 Tax=Strigomonas culicis TaxID=28005 RepID=S9UQF1_9TRYP|nr:translation initiation factor 1A [Strigomonas culicis]EPY33003.1 translation initiation factor 1A [Strigomonas culicis]EPY33112.1 translation initiation factor 1A [Strigomonas culicis]EPY33604.1 translation initiation factor 1A [Strigomonas culicis]|eukprot:EPY30681.1 translation initiation factor 1A [Strigomonas culicis]
MPKNMGKGGKSFKAGNAKGNQFNEKRALVYAEEGEEYAQAKKALGNLNLQLQLASGATVIGRVRGAMVRKVWVTPGDVVLIQKRDFNENDIVDIIHRYNAAEVRTLVKENVIPRDFRSTEERGDATHGDYEFVNEDDNGNEEKEANVLDRNQVVMDDPLAGLDDL